MRSGCPSTLGLFCKDLFLEAPRPKIDSYMKKFKNSSELRAICLMKWLFLKSDCIQSSNQKKFREINFTKKYIPASKLLSNEGLRAQMKAWKEDTVKTPSKFRTALVDCKKYMKIP